MDQEAKSSEFDFSKRKPPGLSLSSYSDLITPIEAKDKIWLQGEERVEENLGNMEHLTQPWLVR
jgi:hypothetical protein